MRTLTESNFNLSYCKKTVYKLTQRLQILILLVNLEETKQVLLIHEKDNVILAVGFNTLLVKKEEQDSQTAVLFFFIIS